MKTKTARSSQGFWIATTIGFALAILLATPSVGSAQTTWTVSPSPSPTNNIYYNAGNVGIGTNAPDQKLVVSANSATTLPASQGIVEVFGADGVAGNVFVSGFGAQAGLLVRRANTSASSPSALQANNLIGLFGAAGYGTTGFQGTRARIGFYASENWTDSVNGTYMAFNTTANGAATAGGIERMRIDNAGNVGIGTATPTAILHIQGSGTSSYRGIQVQNSFTDAETKGAIAIIGARKTNANVPFSGFGTWDNGTSRALYIGGGQWSIPDANVIKIYTAPTYDESNGVSGNLRMLIDSSGNVGIGTTTPTYPLDVAGYIRSTSGGFRFPDSSVQTTAATLTGVTAGTGLTGGGTSGNPTVAVSYGSSPGTAVQGNTSITINAGVGMSGGGPLTLGTTGGSLTLTNNDRGSAQFIFGKVANSSGTTQFSAASNTDAIQFEGTGGTTVTFGGANKVTINSSSITSSQWTTSGANISYTAGNVAVGSGTPTTPLHVFGAGTITGNLTVGGNISAKFQDVAEWVPSSEQIPTGTVVVLDTTKSNQVISSTQSYDTRVAGVVSEQPGIALGESGEGKVLVATTGRVLVKVDASNGPIHIGDLLVTSNIGGVAMKSEPIAVGGRLMHMPGTLIGKALEPLEKGSGKILVLLSLQ